MQKPHKRLEAWRMSMGLAKQVYTLTAPFPPEERYGLTQQMRRAAISIPSNVAEGAARQTKKEFANFLHVAQGSLSELDTQLELAVALGYLKPDTAATVDQVAQRVDKILTGLIKSLRR